MRSIFIGWLAMAVLQAEEPPADPYRINKVVDETASGETAASKNISICYETFSLPLALAARLQREQLRDSELHTRLVTAVEKHIARQETFTVARGKSGLSVRCESLSEQIYATEYEPAQLPNSVGISMSPSAVEKAPRPTPGQGKIFADSPSFDLFKVPDAPAKFKTRPVGDLLEILSCLYADGHTLDVTCTSERVTLAGRSSYGRGDSITQMPLFETQRISTDATFRINQQFLLGTVSRPPDSKADPDSANRVWFAFITGTIASP